MKKRKRLRERIKFREEFKDMNGNLCELCNINESVGLFWIKSSHPFSEIPTKMSLCKGCYRNLERVNVRIKKVETNA